MIKKAGDENEAFTCSDCQKIYKKSIGFYEDNNSNTFLCLKCHDGLEAYKKSIQNLHICPYFSEKTQCELVFEYSEFHEFKCELCEKGPISACAGRFMCKVHNFNVCWECIHPPCSFLVCPYHPYLKLDNDEDENENYKCRVCKRQGKTKEGRYHCPIKGCKFEICWKCYIAPVYIIEKENEAKNENQIPNEIEKEEKNELDERIEIMGEELGENEEEKAKPQNLNDSITKADFEIEFNIPKEKIEESPSTGFYNNNTNIDPKLIHIDT